MRDRKDLIAASTVTLFFVFAFFTNINKSKIEDKQPFDGYKISNMEYVDNSESIILEFDN